MKQMDEMSQAVIRKARQGVYVHTKVHYCCSQVSGQQAEA